MKYNVFFLLIFAYLKLIHSLDSNQQKPEGPPLKYVRNWSEKLGGELWHFGDLVTRRHQAMESFKKLTIIEEHGDMLLKDIAEVIGNFLQKKVDAVKRVVDISEQLAKVQKDHVDPSYDFYNAKNLSNSLKTNLTMQNSTLERHDYENFREKRFLEEEEGYQQDNGDSEIDQDQPNGNEDEDNFDNEENIVTDDELGPMASQKTPTESKRTLPLTPNVHFYNIPVNTNHSAVHVPINVFERSPEVIKGIKWSEQLDDTFRDNYERDPTLSWQYFGSSTGFMRQFPAMIWSQDPIDLFDCRTRSWFIDAATSPKDIIILVDRSGSMTGMRREIARHVVNNILDTLGNNDFVNIYTFSNTTEATVECFNDSLVQANLANVRVLKESMTGFKTEQIANFSLALNTAFELLQKYRENQIGAMCNQAIMLVTDGVQYNYKEIFEKYNWDNLPFIHVRVFTYLIGREVSDVREVKWMACANRGYFVHLSTYAEVREEVLQYIPVMARPMVLNPKHRPVPTWSPVYADVTDPKLTNWLWVTREKNLQREQFRTRTLLKSDEKDKLYVHQQKKKQDNYGELQKYHLMTSVSLPVYDLRPNANITEQIQINEAVWITVTKETRVANLLGVAGTDVPIEYIRKLIKHHRIGVNGYAFLVTNNGYILIHPDLRPVFQGILKPAYNRVDVTEIEIMNDDAEPRDFSEEILKLRNEVTMQINGTAILDMKMHLDNMKRIMMGKRYYHYMPINNTPFSLVLSFPDKYGFYQGGSPLEFDIHRLRPLVNISAFVRECLKDNWTVHPEWNYCNLGKSKAENITEEIHKAFMEIEKPGWKWSDECDRKLMCSLVTDANITFWFYDNINLTNKQTDGPIAMLMSLLPRHELIKRFGITVVFIATQSGLTRWQEFPQNIDERLKDEPKFHQLHDKAIDEVWYRRAVEHYYIDPKSFVYSVPFDVDVDDENKTLVTASHAIFREDGSKKTPVAVVGFQFYYTALQEHFMKTTSNCGNGCKRTCTSGELLCLLLDDNGYIVAAYKPKSNEDKQPQIGTFFGDFRPDIMQQLVKEKIYKAHKMYDYQATCFPTISTGNPATKLFTPLTHFTTLLQYFLNLVLFFTKSIYTDELDTGYSNEESEDDQRSSENDYRALLINKTKPEPCDTKMWLYTLIHYNDKNVSESGYNKENMSEDCSRPFLVEPVGYSNLIFLVVSQICDQKMYESKSDESEMEEEEEEVPQNPYPVEVYYDNVTLSCYKVLYNDFPRRQYMSCINESKEEKEIRLCGNGSKLTHIPWFFLYISLILLIIDY
ncbi:voltage-dependent calcium channel subunit alpha-2/delta-3 isoform X1 [Onthophagus taurus]|uniref:voltage-dependent calcium channel subunit alpha-2/delta-3 isoform X1 n=1 Tax=Onthophagus taurus TaxID=166361 RepID=UPI0039BE881E